MKKSRSVATASCGIVRDCKNQGCIFKMLSLGYKLNPTTDSDKNKNNSLERSSGKGFYPKWTSIPKGERSDIVCSDYKDSYN